MGMKRKKADAVPAPLSVYESRYFLCLTLTQCLALADGVVTEEVQRMANMVDKPKVPIAGVEPYATVIG